MKLLLLSLLFVGCASSKITTWKYSDGKSIVMQEDKKIDGPSAASILSFLFSFIAGQSNGE